jgi:hypothetical protein
MQDAQEEGVGFMKTPKHLLRMTLLAAAVVVAIGGISTLNQVDYLQAGLSAVMSTAHARQGGEGEGSKNGAKGQNPGSQGHGGAGGTGSHGGKSMHDVLSGDDGEDEDSDRPAWAGTPGRDGKPGGGNAGHDTKKGGDYGDLFVILRDEFGEPIKSDGEYYVLLSDGTVVKTIDGEVPSDALNLAIPVEFGRMNIARSPASVLEHSLTEALSKIDGYVITPETIAALTDASGRLVTSDGLTIDSPLENLALYEALLTATQNDDGLYVVTISSNHEGEDTTYTVLVDPAVRTDLAAAAIAASSDKTGTLSADEIVLITSFLGAEKELAEMLEGYTYDKDSAFANEEVSILVDPEGDGTYFTATGDVLDLISTYASDIWTTVAQPEVKDYADGDPITYTTDLSGIFLFTQAADDAVQVLEFVHDREAP